MIRIENQSPKEIKSNMNKLSAIIGESVHFEILGEDFADLEGNTIFLSRLVARVSGEGIEAVVEGNWTRILMDTRSRFTLLVDQVVNLSQANRR